MFLVIKKSNIFAASYNQIPLFPLFLLLLFCLLVLFSLWLFIPLQLQVQILNTSRLDIYNRFSCTFLKIVPIVISWPRSHSYFMYSHMTLTKLTSLLYIPTPAPTTWARVTSVDITHRNCWIHKPWSMNYTVVGTPTSVSKNLQSQASVLKVVKESA